MKVELSIVTCVTRFFGVDEGFKSIVCSIRKDDDDDFVCNQVDGSELLPSATKLRRLCFYRRASVHKGGGVPDQVHPPGTRYTPRD